MLNNKGKRCIYAKTMGHVRCDDEMRQCKEKYDHPNLQRPSRPCMRNKYVLAIQY